MSGSDAKHAGLNLGDSDRQAHEKAEPDVFGFWVFLMSDAVIFALLFATYGVMLAGTAGGPTPVDEYKILPAFIETLILLTSSLTFGLASVTMKHDGSHGQRALLAWLAVTLALGVAFLGFELHDFATMIGEGAVPSRSGYLSAFFGLVPLHGLHVAAGCLWLSVMMVQIPIFGLDDRVKINLLRLGLFWHFLDIIWIAIFSVVYLQGLIQ
ncbi:MAG: cytochrome c oxidase subunit 3 [Sphingomonas bacterium]|nr:cytochrome c oxidase subunit 3 [Sphingomonas bacterium]